MNIAQIYRNKGFTLIELMVVVGIVAITMGIGLPGFQSTIASSRLTSSANEMVVALQVARSESIKGNRFAGVNINSTTGWLVFAMVNGVSTTVQKYAAESGVTLTVNAPSAGGTTPTYRPDGRLNNATLYAMTFSVTGSDEARYLTIQPSGRVGICTPVLPSTTC